MDTRVSVDTTSWAHSPSLLGSMHSHITSLSSSRYGRIAGLVTPHHHTYSRSYLPSCVRIARQRTSPNPQGLPCLHSSTRSPRRPPCRTGIEEDAPTTAGSLLSPAKPQVAPEPPRYPLEYSLYAPHALIERWPANRRHHAGTSTK